MQNSTVTQTDNAVPNTSGQGVSVSVPPEIQGWNWGAFLLTWIWGIGNQVWIALLALIPVPLVSVAVMIILGIKGNEWAWQYKKWDSVDHFRRSQHTWMVWGIISLIAPLVLVIGLILITVGIFGYYGYIKL